LGAIFVIMGHMLEWLGQNWLFMVAGAVVGMILVKNYNKVDRLFHEKEWSDKGSAGERVLYNFLTNELGYPKSMIYRNLLIRDMSGKHAEIDMILLYRYGIVVFEVKNYSGEVFGEEKDKMWEHKVGGRIYQFYNPIMQNEKHIQVLRERLKDDRLKFYSVVIFGDRTIIRRMNYKAKNTWVGKVSGLRRVDEMIRGSSKMGIERGSDDAKRIKKFLRRAERRRGEVLNDRKHK